MQEQPQTYEGYFEDGRFIPFMPFFVEIPERRKVQVTVKEPSV